MPALLVKCRVSYKQLYFEALLGLIVGKKILLFNENLQGQSKLPWTEHHSSWFWYSLHHFPFATGLWSLVQRRQGFEHD